MKTRVLSIVLAFTLAFTMSLRAQNAQQILQKVDRVTTQANDVYQKVKIILIDRHGRKQERIGEIWQKGTNKRLFRFISPASYRGIGVLSLPNDVMYLYMPAYGRERRIASSIKNQKFAGTDLSYSDLEAKKYSEKYTAKILKSDANFYWLEAKPKDRKSQYSKVILKVKKADYTPVYAEFYDRGGHKVKTMSTNFVKQGKYWTAKKITVNDLKTHHTTVMETLVTKYDQGLSDNIFTVRNLKNF